MAVAGLRRSLAVPAGKPYDDVGALGHLAGGASASRCVRCIFTVFGAPQREPKSMPAAQYRQHLGGDVQLHEVRRAGRVVLAATTDARAELAEQLEATAKEETHYPGRPSKLSGNATLFFFVFRSGEPPWKLETPAMGPCPGAQSRHNVSAAPTAVNWPLPNEPPPREARAGRSEDDEEPGAGEGEGRRAAAAAGGLERKVRVTGRNGHM